MLFSKVVIVACLQLMNELSWRERKFIDRVAFGASTFSLTVSAEPRLILIGACDLIVATP